MSAAIRLPVLPLRDVVLYPHVVMPLLVGRPGSLAALQAASDGDGQLLLVAQRDPDVDEPAAADLHRTGVMARLVQTQRLPNGATKVLVEGMVRARVERFTPAGALLRAIAVPTPLSADELEADDEAARRRMLSLFEEYVGLHRRVPSEILGLVQGTEPAARQAYAVAAHLGVRLPLRQELLEASALPELVQRLGELLAAEVEMLRLERKIEDDVRGSVFRNQREFYLQEQLKAIHRELGQEDGNELADLEAQAEQKGLSEVALTRVRRELRKLARMSPMAPEAAVTRNFVDWVLALPWHERTPNQPDIAHARAVLDEDHHGLAEVKDRILDYIAALAMAGQLNGPVLCLVGPPGVGKTSLGRSIARALSRKFVRMSLGGVRDEAEIRGHRRTYVGAMPGRIVQAMRRAEVVNPVLLLDEIDKLGQDFRGDPASALLEVLDPEQHQAFNDHYLELDYDLSQVLFVTTANSLATIPEPLRDRMEIIRLPGYLDQEKLAIADRYLAPRQLSAHGVDPSTVTWAPGAMESLMRGYTREAGVRELERRVARVARKLVRRRLEAADPASEAQQVVRSEDLHALLGPAPYDPDDTTLDDKVGVAAGLAYTSVGGELLEIEVSAVPGRGRLQLTGTLGDVMKESASAALSFIRARSRALGLPDDFHKTRDLHVHIPTGATPKDGPSAGIAIATALVSAITGIPVRGDVAMTGEVTLRGRVLPIGGLREKAVAAHRNGVTHVIIPHANARQLEELPEDVRGAVHFHPVRTMDEVLALALRATEVAADVLATAVITH
ncbi:MAG TPA: endopeptidase La [Gemmatimonadaceae bacterium]|nr:endopeptidase La [Gemmatimonadaceae bacterium]